MPPLGGAALSNLNVLCMTFGDPRSFFGSHLNGLLGPAPDGADCLLNQVDPAKRSLSTWALCLRTA